MKISNSLPSPVLKSAVVMLQQFVPDLSAENLVAAIQGYSCGEKQIIEKPMTRQEAASLLSVDVKTIDRYLKFGYLQKIKLADRLVRIEPQSVKAFISGYSMTTTTAM